MRFVAQHNAFQDRVVVVTGASAGVGRAAARAFARAGAHVGLIARDTEGLERTRAEISVIGNKVMSLPADVADADQVFTAAGKCEQALGPIDVWVNNAMVTVFSALEDLSAAEFRRITEVTYLGYVHGTLAALRRMRERNTGVIVQVGSALAYRGIPLQAGYCGAKHAIRGFTDSLRAELLHAGSNVALTAVHLPAINTPQFDWARTHRDTKPRPIGPVYQPGSAARAILRAARNPQREYWLGGGTPLTILANMLAPGLFDRYIAAQAFKGQHTGQPVARQRRDNLFHPVGGIHRTEGSFGKEARNSAWLFSSASARAAATAAVFIGAGLAGMVVGAKMAGRRERRRRTLSHWLPRGSALTRRAWRR